MFLTMNKYPFYNFELEYSNKSINDKDHDILDESLSLVKLYKHDLSAKYLQKNGSQHIKTKS